MQIIERDVAIIGTGTAGMAAYRAAKAHTQSVALIEAGAYGTTCARVGCMPSKLLIAAAEAAHAIDQAAGFGVHLDGNKRVDGKAVMARVKAERDRFVGFVLESVEGFDPKDRFIGQARFRHGQRLQVGDDLQIRARRIVIATGSRPNIPAFLQAAGDRLVVNDDIFEWDDLPRSVAVFGPGVIGLELGQALHRLGVKVHMFGAGGAVGPFTDPKIRDYAVQTFRSEFYLDADARMEQIQRVDDGVRIRFQDAVGQPHEILVDYLIAATGRRPNVDDLGLENTNLALDARGVPLADPLTMQCGDSPIFIAGDASNQIPLLHEAADQGKIAGDNAGRFPKVQPGLRRSAIAAVFSDPQLAMVGSSYRQVQQAYAHADCYAIGEVSFENQGRSRVMRKNKGLLRVYAEQASGRFLGAEMIGPAAEHIAHLLSWAHQQRLTIDQMLDMPFYHPVIEEGLRTALRDVYAQLQARAAVPAECESCLA